MPACNGRKTVYDDDDDELMRPKVYSYAQHKNRNT